MEKEDDPYKILGVAYDAEESEIRREYKKAALKWHPDRTTAEGDKEHASKIFAKISEAYTMLKDPVKRYDWKSANEDKIKKHITTTAFVMSAPPPPPTSSSSSSPTKRKILTPPRPPPKRPPHSQHSRPLPPPPKSSITGVFGNKKQQGLSNMAKEHAKSTKEQRKAAAASPKLQKNKNARKGSPKTTTPARQGMPKAPPPNTKRGETQPRPLRHSMSQPPVPSFSPAPSSQQDPKRRHSMPASSTRSPRMGRKASLESRSNHASRPAAPRTKNPSPRMRVRKSVHPAPSRGGAPMPSQLPTPSSMNRRVVTTDQIHVETRIFQAGISSNKNEPFHNPFQIFDQVMRTEFGTHYKTNRHSGWESQKSTMFGGEVKLKAAPPRKDNPNAVLELSTLTETEKRMNGRVEIKTTTTIEKVNGRIDKIIQISLTDKETAKQLPNRTNMTMKRAKQ